MDHPVAPRHNQITQPISKHFASGVALPAAALLWLSFIGCDTALAIAAICVCVATNAFIYSGMYVSKNFLA